MKNQEDDDNNKIQYIVKLATPDDDQRVRDQADYLSSSRDYHSLGPPPTALGLIFPRIPITQQRESPRWVANTQHCVWGEKKSSLAVHVGIGKRPTHRVVLTTAKIYCEGMTGADHDYETTSVVYYGVFSHQASY